MDNNITIFVASSNNHIAVANALKSNLDNLDTESTISVYVWDERTFTPGGYFLDSLTKQANNCNYAIFIFAPDDQLLIENKQVPTVRDNVLFELGLFSGIIGRDKCFVVMPDKFNMRIASDLRGIHFEKYYLKYEHDLNSATKNASTNIFNKIRKESNLQSSRYNKLYNPTLFLGLKPNKSAIIYHCDDLNKYHKYHISPTGSTLESGLENYIDNLNCAIFTPLGMSFSYLLRQVSEFDTIFVVDSPPYNMLCKYIIENYRKIMTGGFLRSLWSKDNNRILQSIIVNGINKIDLKSNKYDVTDGKDTFGHFNDYLVIMRLPWILPRSQSQIEQPNTDKLIWLIYGLHTKGSHAAVSVFSKSNLNHFIKNITEHFNGILPDYFEVIYKVADNKNVVDHFNDFDLIHYSMLQPKAEMALQDSKPSNIAFYFADSHPEFPINKIPVHAVHLDVCSACNFRCPRCIEHKIRDMKVIMSYEKIVDILCDLKKANCRHVNFYGGEPTLHPDFVRILKIVDTMGFKSLLVTNGSQLYRKEVVAAVLNCTNMHIRVSLDAHSNETHCSNHGLDEKDACYELICQSINSLLEQIHTNSHHSTSISISCLLYDNIFKDDELLRSCEFWKKKGATSFHLRPVAELHGKIKNLDSVYNNRFLIRHILQKYKYFAIAPEWFKDYISKDDRELPAQTKNYNHCYSAYYRFAISPYKILNTEYNHISIPGIDNEVAVTNDAMISLCTYNRLEPNFSVNYPDNFTNWLSRQRIEKAKTIDPKTEPCNSTFCCRADMNLETAQSISIV